MSKMDNRSIRTKVRQMIDGVNVQIAQSLPSVLVVPGGSNNQSEDRGIAAALRQVRDSLNSYDTVIVLGAYFPRNGNETRPPRPLSGFSGSQVLTSSGSFEINRELMGVLTQSQGGNVADDLIKNSPYYEQAFLWLHAMLPEEGPRPKVLPLILCATMREEVAYVARVLNDNLFGGSDNTTFGLGRDGKRYLIVLPLQVSSGLALFRNVYVENILLDLTFRSHVGDFEQWLYYLTGNSGATFSHTIASQILAVHLSYFASSSQSKSQNLEWRWRIIDYYTTFDSKMNASKMILNEYYDEEDGIFGEEDNPQGYQICYAMSLSLDEVLHKSETNGSDGEKKVSMMFQDVSNPLPFSKAAMQELFYAAQTSILGKQYIKTTQKHILKELDQRMPFKLRVYVLAQHDFEAKSVFRRTREAKQADQVDQTSTCRENVLFEVRHSEFTPQESVLDAATRIGRQLFEQRMAPAMLARFTRELQKKHQQLVKEGVLPKNQLRDLNLNLQDNLVMELQVFHSWEHRNIFELREARGNFISLWDGRFAICEVPQSRPSSPADVFFRLTQCCLKNGLGPWDWQRGVVHVFDRTRLTKPVHWIEKKDEL